MPDTPNPQSGIDGRSLRFACEVIEFVRTIRYEPGARKVIEQLVDASGSIGANRDEATSASSRKEFIRYNEIALRSAKESWRWLRVCGATGMGDPTRCATLVDEARQLANILGAIVTRAKRNNP